MNYWHVYHRAHLYRIGRPWWWGMQWVKKPYEYEVPGGPMEFESLDGAKMKCGQYNSRLDVDAYYRAQSWIRVANP